MKNTLSDLNNYLFETLERLLDDELTDAHCLGCMVAYLKRPAENEVSG